MICAFLNAQLFLLTKFFYPFKKFYVRVAALTFHCLQCIASTTLDEYRTQFEKDKALARRFQPVLISEPSQVVFHMYINLSVISQFNFYFLFVLSISFLFYLILIDMIKILGRCS